MSRLISRRDFLKLASLAAGGLATRPLHSVKPLDPNRPNIIILLFDTFSGTHLSSNGYPRQTTPNFDRFAARANVYHNHYAAGPFTTPGTASILTGLYPWTHRAIHYAGTIRPQFAWHNFFDLLGDVYHTTAFTQNLWADVLLRQFGIDQHLPPSSYSLVSGMVYDSPIGMLDPAAFYRSTEEFALTRESFPGLPNLAFLRELNAGFRKAKALGDYSEDYPLGVPSELRYMLYFLNNQIFAGLQNLLESLPQPQLSYFHFFAPHEPYAPHRNFMDRFKDDYYLTPDKKISPFGDNRVAQESLNQWRYIYDGYILNLDEDFGCFMDFLDSSHLLETSYVIVLSDHGQLFERGIHGHGTSALYDGVLHVPLMIHAPGQDQRLDVYERTCNVDLLPTLLTIAGKPIPAWAEGVTLPGFAPSQSDRAIFASDTKSISVNGKLTRGAFAVMRGDYRLVLYKGFSEAEDWAELYDLSRDPEEMTNLFKVKPETVNELMRDLSGSMQLAEQKTLGDR